MSVSTDNPLRSPVDRRHFIAVMGGGAAAVGLAACGPDGPDAGEAKATSTEAATEGSAAASDSGSEASATGTPAQGSGDSAATFDARSDSIIPDLTPIADLQPADASEERMTYAPAVPAPIARTDQRIVEFDIDVIEGECPLDPANDVSTLMWGFRIGGDSTACGSPGPILRARVGDLARITVNNQVDSKNPHNIDFHAVTGQGGGATATTVAPGESATINCRLLYPGAFMYHCAFGDVPKHIVHGMYGMFIVDTETPLPEVDHEWSIMQSEWYLADPVEEASPEFDPDRLLLEHPTYVTFNGRTDALIDDNALQMEVGQRARFFMVNEGLNLDSNFHPIGSHWDLVYPEAATHPINPVIRGTQSTLVVAGGGTVTELIGQVPSTILLVDHALVRTFYKGAIGHVVISGDPNGIFSAGDDGLAEVTETEPVASAPVGGENAVVIPQGAFDPANADTAFSPSPVTVAVGSAVTWTNDDSVFHTVTSGSSTGTVGTPDGDFDSGEIQPGESFTLTFDEAGTFDYYCIPHPWMIGQVVVTG